MEVCILFYSWSTDVEKLTMILSEALNEVFLEVLTFTRSLHYDALLGVTVNNDTTFVFDLQGKAGLPVILTNVSFKIKCESFFHFFLCGKWCYHLRSIIGDSQC